MRAAIRLQLKTIAGVQEVYQGYTAPDEAAIPYLVVVFTDKDQSVNNRSGYFQRFSVMIYTKEKDFQAVDDLVAAVRTKLNDVLLTTTGGRKFRPEYVSTLEDYYEEETQLLSRRVDFSIPC